MGWQVSDSPMQATVPTLCLARIRSLQRMQPAHSLAQALRSVSHRPVLAQKQAT